MAGTPSLTSVMELASSMTAKAPSVRGTRPGGGVAICCILEPSSVARADAGLSKGLCKGVTESDTLIRQGSVLSLQFCKFEEF